MRSKPVRASTLFLLVYLLGACAAITRDESLRVVLYNYSAAVRWNEITQAAGFVAPETLAAKPFTPQLQERWAQVQVSRYLEGPSRVGPEGQFLQTVQIEVIDRSTQSVRTIVDHQIWRYEPAVPTWYLQSGLPELE